MSDIPDWLVELAAQRDEGDDENTEAEELEEPEWDFLRSEPEPQAPSAEIPVAPEVPTPADEVVDVPVTVDMDEGELIDVLRSQVEVDSEMTEAVEASPRRRLRIPGLLPWQQFVLALLLLLDIVVIGLLFLVMLGRMSIG